jgi:hypothetical protein
MIAKTFEKVNNLLKEPHETKPTKKRPHVNETTIFNFLMPKIFIKKWCVIESIFRRFCSFNCKKSFANASC